MPEDVESRELEEAVRPGGGFRPTNREGRKFWVRHPIKFGVRHWFNQSYVPDPNSIGV